jgi:predicted signal transduction protein with EAL and GGDEF domain
VDANSSWLELFGFVDAAGLIGQPAMDLFDADTQVPLKGALSACLQGRWSGHVLKAGAQLADGSIVPIDLQLIAGDFEGEPCVRLLVPAQRQDEKRMATDLADAVHRDPSTGLWTRRYLLEQLTERLATPAPGGVRYIACVRPDKFSAFEREVGVLASARTCSRSSRRWCARCSDPTISPAALGAPACCCCSSAATRATSRPGARNCSSASGAIRSRSAIARCS